MKIEMEYKINFAILFQLLTVQGYCTTSKECGAGQCCTGGFYNRHCRRLGGDGKKDFKYAKCISN